ncbi:MAG: hypothetical protein J6W28_08105 [Clostridia bacterium]|nr:hypothetical protein [Clostridia bacterium]
MHYHNVKRNQNKIRSGEGILAALFDDACEKVEKNVCLMEENGLSCGGCHDF